MRKLFYPFLLVFLVFPIGCGPKISDVLKKYEGDFQKKREQFKAIAQALPPMGGPETPCNNINPPLQFNEKTKQTNTEIIMFDQLADPDLDPKFDFYFSGELGELLNGLRWTGPKNPLSPDVLGKRGKDMEQGLKAALDDRYLVVNRVVELTESKAIDEQTFTPGQVRIETFVVDLSNNKPLCNFTIEGKSAPNVHYSFREGESKEEQLSKAAHSTVWEEARKQLIARLKATPNSTIEIE